MARKQNAESDAGRDERGRRVAHADSGGGGTSGGRGKLEWAVSIASAFLILAMLVYLAWEGLTLREPPSFQAAVDSIWTAAGRHYISADIQNTGDNSVESIIVGFELMRADSMVAETEVTLDWLPAHSRREVVALFDDVPRRHRITVEVRGYLVP